MQLGAESPRDGSSAATGVDDPTAADLAFAGARAIGRDTPASWGFSPNAFHSRDLHLGSGGQCGLKKACVENGSIENPALAIRVEYKVDAADVGAAPNGEVSMACEVIVRVHLIQCANLAQERPGGGRQRLTSGSGWRDRPWK